VSALSSALYRIRGDVLSDIKEDLAFLKMMREWREKSDRRKNISSDSNSKCTHNCVDPEENY